MNYNPLKGMSSKGFTSFILAVLISCAVNAQDKILLLNGRLLDAKVTKVSDATVEYSFSKGKKTKTGVLENYRVFSVTKSGEKENVLYEQDTLIGNFYNEDEMRMFINGQKDAHDNYNPKWALVGGALFSYAVFTWNTRGRHHDPDVKFPSNIVGLFKEGPTLLSIVAIPAFTIAVGLPKVKIDVNNVSNRAYLADQYYLEGYERVARSSKVIDALKGSAAGFVLGYLTYFIFKP
jgi:hypothetical protein